MVRTPCVVDATVQVKKESMSCAGVPATIAIQAVFIPSLAERTF